MLILLVQNLQRVKIKKKRKKIILVAFCKNNLKLTSSFLITLNGSVEQPKPSLHFVSWYSCARVPQ